MPTGPTIRPPKQERSRLGWERILSEGFELMLEGGVGALTVSEVCRRAGVAQPSLYARVDTRAGLIAAVYEHAMARVHRTELDLLANAPSREASIEVRVGGAVALLCEVFARNRRLFRAVISASVEDSYIHRRGVEESKRVREQLAGLMSIGEAGQDIAAMIYAECIVRAMYGGEFMADRAEAEATFRSRLTRMALARTQA